MSKRLHYQCGPVDGRLLPPLAAAHRLRARLEGGGMTRFPLLDERCSECGHRIGVHYAVSNANEAFGTWCSESGCICGTDPDAEWRIGTQLPDRHPAPGGSAE